MKPISLTRYLIQEQHAGRINADLRLLIEVVARACKTISIAVGKGALGGVLGDAGTGNIQGEAQKKLDVLSNEILLEANEWGGHLAGLASEEMEHANPNPNDYPKGNYLLLFDPLDGSWGRIGRGPPTSPASTPRPCSRSPRRSGSGCWSASSASGGCPRWR